MLKGRKLEERMGHVLSRSRVKFGKKTGKGGDKDEKAQAKDTSADWIAELRELEKDGLARMTRLIRERPGVFVLNNLLMSCQLFDDYEAEIELARERAERRGEDLRRKLDSEKTVLTPDALREHFRERMRFASHCRATGDSKDEQTIEPLRPAQVYLVYDNVIITETSDPKQYENPTKLRHAQYTFAVQANARNGYVRLEQTSKLASIMESIDEIYQEKSGGGAATRSMVDLTASEHYFDGAAGGANNSSSTQDLSSDVYSAGTARITALTNHPSSSTSSSTSSGYTSTSNGSSGSDSTTLSTSACGGDAREIPAGCFKSVTYMYNGKVYNPRREQKPLTSQQKRIRDAKLLRNYDVVYVNSYRFAKHFYAVFRDQLAARMGFDETSVKSAKRCDATVRLETIEYSMQKNCISIEQFEIMPCFSSPCPEWAQRWLKRPGRTSWPNEMDLAKLSKYQCYLIPESQRGAIESGGADSSKPMWKLDWCMTFATAEHYLETRLSAAQMTVYAIALMMHKTFVRSAGSALGLDTSHIRNLLFWMIERTPERDEFDMGELMIDLLETLHGRIQKRAMPDYFLEARNLFENVHMDDLLHSQKQLKRIIENPVMFVFHAMEKMQYEGEDYPRLDYKELLRLLTVEEMLLINPHLEVKKPEEQQQQIYGKGERKFWSDAKQTGNLYSRKRGTSTLINPKQVVDSIIDIQEKCEPLRPTRLWRLLIFFSKHFIEMSKSCNKLGAARQKAVYLQQTRLLALLLTESDDLDHRETAEQILKRVNEIEENPINAPLITRQQQAPETPKRNSDAPLARRRLNDTIGLILPPVREESNDKVVRVEVHDTPIKSALSKPTFLKKSAMTSAMKSKVEATSL